MLQSDLFVLEKDILSCLSHQFDENDFKSLLKYYHCAGFWSACIRTKSKWEKNVSALRNLTHLRHCTFAADACSMSNASSSMYFVIEALAGGKPTTIGDGVCLFNEIHDTHSNNTLIASLLVAIIIINVYAYLPIFHFFALYLVYSCPTKRFGYDVNKLRFNLRLFMSGNVIVWQNTIRRA